MTEIFWGVPVKFERFEKVIIDSAEVRGLVTNIRIDSEEIDVMYYVVHKRGAVYGGEKYMPEFNGLWLKQSQIRKIKPKKPMLESLREFLSKYFGSNK